MEKPIRRFVMEKPSFLLESIFAEEVTQSRTIESYLQEIPEFPEFPEFPYGVVEAAKQYHQLGFSIIPLKKGTKIPVTFWKNQQMYKIPKTRIDADFKGNGIGVITGPVSGNLLVIDCDTKEAFDKYRDIAEKHNFAKWLVETNRGGHIWLLYEGGKIMNYTVRQESDSVEFWAESNHYVVAPPSVNGDTGQVYTWVVLEGEFPPVLSVRTLRELFPFLDVRIASELPHAAHEVLVEGNTKKYGGDNSAAEFAAVCSLVTTGYSDDEILELFEEFSPPHFSERDEAWFRKQMIAPAREEHKPLRDRELIRKVVSWIHAQPWPGKAGSTDKKILLALTERAKLESETDARMTIREAGLLAGVWPKTAGKSINRLKEAGLLEQVPSDGRLGNRYRFSKKLCDDANNNTRLNFNGVNQVDFQEHDVWKNGALGSTGLEVYISLLNLGAQSTKELHACTKKHPATIRNSLKKLRMAGLVQKEKRLYRAISVEVEYFDALADEAGTLGVQKKREERIRAEREAHYSTMRYKKWS